MDPRAKPSLAIWIDPDSQEVKTDFMPQRLKPGEYGVALSMVIVHVARCFRESNPNFTEEEILSEILRGISHGVEHKPPTTPMVSH